MGSEWTEILLEDLADEVTVGFVGSMASEYVEDGIPFFRSKNVSPYRINWDDVKYVSREFHQKIKKSTLGPGDVVIVRTGKPGTACIIPDEITEANCSDLVIVRPGPDLDKNFLVYYLNSAAAHHISSHLVGAVQQHFNVGAAKKLSIPLPPLPKQKAIAHILGTLDDKIELNRRMNATLEGMAQALFKSWFIDFDPVIDNILVKNMSRNQPSPNLSHGERNADAQQSSSPLGRSGDEGSIFDGIPEELAPRAEARRHVSAEALAKGEALANGTANRDDAKHFPAAFQDTESMGWIPEGWDVSDIENSTSTIIDHRGKTPKKLGHDWAESGIPAVSAKNIKDGKLVRKDTIKFTDTALYDRWMVEELQKGDILMTSEAPLGEKLFLAKKFKWVLSQRLFALRANDQISGAYLYHWLNTDIAKADIDGRASGTTVQGIRQSELRKVKVLTPDENSIAAFSDACDALMEKRAINEENTEQLISLRDTLLPKLVSGDLRVNQSTNLEGDNYE